MAAKKRLFIVLTVISILIGSLLSLLAVAFVVTLPWSLLYVGTFLSPDPEPAIKYGEFPFELTCEVNGERITINDVYICKLDGYDITENGKIRRWKGYVKSSEESMPLIAEIDGLKIYCFVGSAKFYMDDEAHLAPAPLTPKFYVKNDLTGAMDLYNQGLHRSEIKLISWKYTEPIENSCE